MTSKKQFAFSVAGFVPPIPCENCGNNAPCIRRSPIVGPSLHEMQIFECSACGRQMKNLRSAQESDDEIERIAERMTGIAPLRKIEPGPGGGGPS